MDPDVQLLTASAVGIVRGGERVLHGMDLQVLRGEVAVVVGPRSDGTAGLADVLAGDEPLESGAITITGSLVSGLRPIRMDGRSVRANVQLALRSWGVPRGRRRRLATAAAQRMCAEHLWRRDPSTLSAAEDRRVRIARALAIPSDLLLLDEPFSDLAGPERSALVRDAAAAFRDPGRAVVVVTAEVTDAWTLADRLHVVLDGGLVASGTPEALRSARLPIEVARYLDLVA